MREYAVHRSKFKLITGNIYATLRQNKKLSYSLGYSRLSASVGTCQDIHPMFTVKIQIIGHYMIRLLCIKCCKLDIVYAASLHVISALGIGYLGSAFVRLICRVHNSCFGKYCAAFLQFFYILSPSYIICKFWYKIRHVCYSDGYVLVKYFPHPLNNSCYQSCDYPVCIPCYILGFIRIRNSNHACRQVVRTSGYHSSLHFLLKFG